MKSASSLLAILVMVSATGCTAGSASSPPGGTPSACSADQSQCGSGECVAASALCDGVSDCADGSDEQNCGSGSGGAATGGAGGGAPSGGAGGGLATTGGGTGGGGAPTGGTGGGAPSGGSSGAAPSGGSGGDAPTGGSSGALTGGSGGDATTGGSSGAAPTGGSGGDAPTGGTGAAATGGSGGDATGGSGGDATGGTGGSEPGVWHGYTSSSAASSLSSEYQAWKSTYVRECSADSSACVVDGNGVYSEGIAYGMLLAANNHDQDLFDKLWKFYTDHMDENGLMNWAMAACDPPGDNDANAASDGDLDAAMALLQADYHWGGYAADALALIDAIREHETYVCDGMNILGPGDMWGACDQINPSYFAPGYYRVFAQYDTANADFWNKLADDSYTLLADYQSRMNGLVPEWAWLDGNFEDNYDYNACRTPWRVATDYAWFGNSDAQTFLQNVSDYVDSQGGVANVPFAKNSAFLGAFALSGIAIDQATFDSYYSSWMNAQKDDNPYFQATLRVVYLLVAAGQFASTL
jgi:endo-1,4-beta-D-glucanase Y